MIIINNNNEMGRCALSQPSWHRSLALHLPPGQICSLFFLESESNGGCHTSHLAWGPLGPPEATGVAGGLGEMHVFGVFFLFLCILFCASHLFVVPRWVPL